MRFPGWLALLPVAGAVAVILAGPEAAVNRIVFSNRAVVFVGLISYPLYLWHWPLISYAYVIRLGKAPTPLMATALVAASFLLAWATYRFIEYPVRFGAHRHRRTQIVAACVAALGACGLAVWTKNGFPERFPPLPGIDIRKIGEAKLDADFKPTKGMEVLDHGWTLVAHLGHGERKVALSGDSHAVSLRAPSAATGRRRAAGGQHLFRDRPQVPSGAGGDPAGQICALR